MKERVYIKYVIRHNKNVAVRVLVFHPKKSALFQRYLAISYIGILTEILTQAHWKRIPVATFLQKEVTLLLACFETLEMSSGAKRTFSFLRILRKFYYVSPNSKILKTLYYVGCCTRKFGNEMSGEWR